jgi:hypothetical protein
VFNWHSKRMATALSQKVAWGQAGAMTSADWSGRKSSSRVLYPGPAGACYIWDLLYKFCGAWEGLQVSCIRGSSIGIFGCFVSFIDALGSRVSSGSIVSDYGLDDRAIGVRSPAGAKDFSSNFCVQTGSGVHPASCTMGTGDPFPGGKARPGRDADHSLTSAEVVNE